MVFPFSSWDFGGGDGGSDNGFGDDEDDPSDSSASSSVLVNYSTVVLEFRGHGHDIDSFDGAYKFHHGELL